MCRFHAVNIEMSDTCGCCLALFPKALFESSLCCLSVVFWETELVVKGPLVLFVYFLFVWVSLSRSSALSNYARFLLASWVMAVSVPRLGGDFLGSQGGWSFWKGLDKCM